MSKLILMLAVFLIVFVNIVESTSLNNNTISLRRTIASASHGEQIIRRNKQDAPSPDGAVHKYAFGAQTGANYFGTRARLSVWKPTVGPKQVSLSQVWVTSTPGPNMNTIEAGWLVTADNVLSLFTYWSVSNYRGTQCYNLECEGYVQLSKETIPGRKVLKTSVPNNFQSLLDIHIFKDNAKNIWSLKVDGELIGYWKEDLFPELKKGASMLLWGGEVIVPKGTLPRDFPPMGSGVRPMQNLPDNFKKVCYIEKIMVTDSSGTEKPAQPNYPLAEPKECFGTVPFGGGFYFGGTCPRG